MTKINLIHGNILKLANLKHCSGYLQATEAVESICIDLPNSKEVYLNAEAFVRMTKLRLLKVRYNCNIDSDEEALSCEDLCNPDDCKQQLTGDLKFLSHELRCLLWYGCPLKSLPSNFQPKNLFHLDMPYSNIHKLWEGTKVHSLFSFF